MQTLGQVDSIICSKSAFIGEQEVRNIQMIKVGVTTFENDLFKNSSVNATISATEELDESLNSSIESIELNKNELDYIPSQVKNDKTFVSKAIEQIKDENHIDHFIFQEFLLALVLCHQAEIVKQKNDDIGGRTGSIF